MNIKRVSLACLAGLSILVSAPSIAMSVPTLTIQMDNNLKKTFQDAQPKRLGNWFGYSVQYMTSFSHSPLTGGPTYNLCDVDINTAIAQMQNQFSNQLMSYNGLVSLEFFDDASKQIKCNTLSFDPKRDYKHIVVHLAQGSSGNQCVATYTAA